MADTIVIGNFLEEIYKTAEQRRLDEMEKIKKYRDETLQKMREASEIEGEHDYQSEMHKVELQIAAEFSHRESALREELFRRREQITKEVFAEVAKKLQAFTSSADYEALLKKDAQEIGKLLPEGEAVLTLRPEDERYAGMVGKAFGRPCNIVFSEKIKTGGILASCGIVTADNTLDARLLEQQAYFIENSGLKVV